MISPNEKQSLQSQFEIFLTQFNHTINSVFTAIASSTSHSQQQQPDQISILEDYLHQLLNIYQRHDLNSKKIQNYYLTLNQHHLLQFKKKLNTIFNLKKKLDRICLDGQLDSLLFKKLNNLSLTPNHIMSYARLIAPYTSAPPAPSTANQDQLINPSAGLDLHDPTLRFLMPFPTEDVIRRGRMGQEMLATTSGENPHLQNGNEIGTLLGEIRTADGARPNQTHPQFQAYPTMPPRRAPPPPLPEAEDDLFDLDLNPDL